MLGALFSLRCMLRADPFSRIRVAPERPVRRGGRPPRITYCILFTPRSGSSRVTDILARTGRLGTPREFFNPAALPQIAEKFNATSLPEYVDRLGRVRTHKGVFGFQVTYEHLITVFRTEEAFRQAFASARFFWLVRRDIVAQAVSGSRMVQTELRHLERPDPSRVAEAEARFRYRPLDIRFRIQRLAWMEKRTERFLERFGIVPVRLCHEQLVHMPEREVARLFAQPLGLALGKQVNPVSTHAQVSADKSAEFADRFRAEHRGFLRRVDAARNRTLRGLETEFTPLAEGS